jgi:hypothetical protein
MRSGGEFGRDLAAALIAASRDFDRDQQRKMARIVLRQIVGAVQMLVDAGFPAPVVAEFDRACRDACRAELLEAVARGRDRAAAGCGERAA